MSNRLKYKVSMNCACISLKSYGLRLRLRISLKVLESRIIEGSKVVFMHSLETFDLAVKTASF